MTVKQDSPWRRFDEVADFIDEIIHESKTGYNFTPFIGSGMSAPSGIVMGQQFQNLLCVAVSRVIGLNGQPFWSLKEKGWPQPTQDELATTHQAISALYTDICKKCYWEVINDGVKIPISGFRPQEPAQLLVRPLIPTVLNATPEVRRDQRTQREMLRVTDNYVRMLEFAQSPGYSETSKERIFEFAVRALHDWRSSLHFLSRIEVRNKALRIKGPDSSIIDGFNAHIVGGKRPNFGHSLLAHLAEPLRFRVILTTNFDVLLEEAFREARKPLRVFEVSSKGHLPASEIIHAQNCLIKLHGGILESRADLTLDELPSEDDCEVFRRLFSGKFLGDDCRSALPSHLLVLGYSANDMRCVRMIKAALDDNPDFKVFWVCYHESDAENIAAIFEEASYEGRLNYCITRRPDLLLYELYQKLSLCLPGGGVSYHYAHRVPPEIPLSKFSSVSYSAEEYADEACAVMNAPGPKPYPPFAPTPKGTSGRWHTIDGDSGVAAHGQTLFNRLRQDGTFQCVWLELQDFLEPRAVVNEFLQTISLRRGSFTKEHLIYTLPVNIFGANSTDLENKFKEHIKALAKRIGINPKYWWLFIYGRNEPGRCAGWISGDDNGWSKEEEADLQRYLELLTSDEIGFNVVEMPMSAEREKSIDNRLELVSDSIARLDVLVSGKPTTKTTSSIRKGSHQSLFSQALNTIEQYGIDYITECQDIGATSRPARDRLRFLYALTLFRQSRHASSFAIEAVYRCPARFNIDGVDNDARRMRVISQWVNELIDCGVLWRKQGGTLWFYRDMRLGLRAFLMKLEKLQHDHSRRLKMPSQVVEHTSLRLQETRSRMHFWIGEWYQHAFYATGNHQPLVEAVYQYIESAMHAADAGSTGRGGRGGPESYRLRRFETAIGSAVKLLVIARPWLKFWLQSYRGPTIFHRALTGPPKLIDHLGEGLRRVKKGCKNANALKMVGRIENGLARFQNELSLTTAALDAESGSDSVWQVFAETAPSVKSRNTKGSMTWPSTDVESLGTDVVWSEPYDKWAIQQADCRIISEIVRWTESTAAAEFLDLQIKSEISRMYDAQPGTSTNEMKMFEVGELLGEFCYLLVRRSRLLEQCCVEQIGIDARTRYARLPKKTSDYLGRLRVAICACSIAALNICSRLNPFFLQREIALRLKVLDLYGLALAQLGRFYEAHRRFDMVLGLLSKAPGVEQTSVRLRTELRKAEAHLLEARFIRTAANSGGSSKYLEQLHPAFASLVAGSHEWQRLHTAKVDDAWVCLENAKAMLSGRNHSSLWWGRLLTLELECYAEIGPVGSPMPPERVLYEPLVLRQRVEHTEEIQLRLEHAALVSPSDAIRRMRFLEAAMSAFSACIEYFGENDERVRRANVKAAFESHFASLSLYLGAFSAPILRDYESKFRTFFK